MEGTVLEDTEWGSFAGVKWDKGSDESDEKYEEYRWGVEKHGFENCDIWDSAFCQITNTLTGHKDDVKCVTFSPDGSQLASASDDKTIMVFKVRFSFFSAFLSAHGHFLLISTGLESRFRPNHESSDGT